MSSPDVRRGEPETVLRLMAFHGTYEDLGVLTGFTGQATIDERRGIFVGYIDDIHGPAGINGKIEGSKMKFTKLYRSAEDNPHPISYQFHKDTYGSGWHGTFSYGPQDRSQGRSYILSLSRTRSATTADQFLTLLANFERSLRERRQEIEQMQSKPQGSSSFA